MSQYAAIDIGSNSIRMLAAEVDANGKTLVLASERQVVRLGTSVFREGRLNEATMNLACSVLAGSTISAHQKRMEATTRDSVSCQFGLFLYRPATYGGSGLRDYLCIGTADFVFQLCLAFPLG